MSRIAKKPIIIPETVQCKVEDKSITFSKGSVSLTRTVSDKVSFEMKDNVITFEPMDTTKEAHAQSGTERALVQNNLTGVAEGYKTELQIYGVGYKAKLEGSKLVLSLGYSHPIYFEVPQGITIEVPSQTEVVVKGADKQLVGQCVANIRDFRRPDAYKGKGVRLKNEQIILKEGKKK
ncbi:MAG: 50S ribosomal protein L6 [Pseudomonadota bacterium]|nr:50S ribosomal protein L6 [Pseudomonadota bacterium]